MSNHKTLLKLPAIENRDFFAGTVSETPQGEIEEELAQIWSEALKVSPIGRNDSFFELGGDSLLATTILHKIQDVFGVELTLRAIFELQTVKEIAEIIDNVYSSAIGEVINDINVKT